jgi:Na+/melibiose symporter-like transporter
MNASVDRRRDRPTVQAWRMTILVLSVATTTLVFMLYFNLRNEVIQLRKDVVAIKEQYVKLSTFVSETAQLKEALNELRKEALQTEKKAAEKFGKKP